MFTLSKENAIYTSGYLTMKRSCLYSVLFLAFCSTAHAYTSKLIGVGYNQQVIQVGETTTAQGESTLCINIQGLGDQCFTPVDEGQWNTGKPGARQFYRHWKGVKSGFITVTTWEHEENNAYNITLNIGKDYSTIIPAIKE